MSFKLQKHEKNNAALTSRLICQQFLGYIFILSNHYVIDSEISYQHIVHHKNNFLKQWETKISKHFNFFEFFIIHH